MRYLSILICLCMLVGCNAKCPCPKGPPAASKPNTQILSGKVTDVTLNTDDSLTLIVVLNEFPVQTWNVGKNAELTANGAVTTTAGVYQLWKLEVSKPLLVSAWVHSGHYVSQAKFWR